MDSLLIVRGWIVVGLVLGIMGAGEPSPVSAANTARQELPLIPAGLSAQDRAALQPILSAVETGEWNQALHTTLTLRQRPEPLTTALDEFTAFLVGDLYARRAAAGDARLALRAFEDARRTFPDSDNAVRALWRIGQIYAAMDLAQEAIASFKRTAAGKTQTPFAILAQLDLGDLYRNWEQWPEADDVYRKLRALKVPPAERIRAVLGSAEIASRMGRTEDAYRMYRDIESETRENAAGLFSFAETAYRTKRYEQARNLFLAFYNIYSQDPLAPVAYAFVADTLRINKHTRNAELAYDEIIARPAESLGDKLGLLMAAMGKRQLRGCAPIPSGFDDEPCRGKDKTEHNPLWVARDLATQASALIRERPADPILRRLVFNVATSLRGYGLIDDALQLHHAIVLGLPPSPMKDRLNTILRDTAEAAVQLHVQAQDDFGAVRVFYAYRSAFTSDAMTGRIGLSIAESHARLGLIAQAIELAGPIAANRPRFQGEEALYILADGYRRRGEYDRAQLRFGQYLNRYPGSPRSADAFVHWVHVVERQGPAQDTFLRYQAWINQYGGTAGGGHVALRVADSLGNAAYVDGRYPDAVRYYQAALSAPAEADRAWAQLQFGNSLLASGHRERGLAALTTAAAGPPNSLTARFAALKMQDALEAK
ncbi:MAG: tetratricopeptide repeat protein [Nitrospirota bacterium]